MIFFCKQLMALADFGSWRTLLLLNPKSPFRGWIIISSTTCGENKGLKIRIAVDKDEENYLRPREGVAGMHGFCIMITHNSYIEACAGKPLRMPQLWTWLLLNKTEDSDNRKPFRYDWGNERRIDKRAIAYTNWRRDILISHCQCPCEVRI